ncbi:hypothetical protein BDP81DRAFT_427623 [Colletotrichum phormii]|uniref:MARVEL domain-containing protein n=1 Tax=Colletotrichum phormii TaxID=359342 RepID=A0AAJ0EEX1_9PEZI|nr:uncharacterized protein BDP81DRAFT_427623 [Colletotrichum phormii]KAK1636444.1 hypothetical protein BDP81DRAFT_427623 [Colletotrichum phormii]
MFLFALVLSFSSWVILATLGSEHCTLESDELFIAYGVSAIVAFLVSYRIIIVHWPQGMENTSGVMTASMLGYGIAVAHSFVTGPWHNSFFRHSYQFSGICIGFLIEWATGWCGSLASTLAERFRK